MSTARKIVELKPGIGCLAELLGFHLRRASQTVQSDLAETLAPHGLRMITFSALAVTGENPGIRQSDLASVLSVERPNLVVVIDELEAGGLVRRDQAPTDRRAHVLNTTAKGQALLRKARKAVEAHERRLFGALPTGKRDELLSILGGIGRRGRAR